MKKPLPEFSIAGVDAILAQFGDRMDEQLPFYLAKVRERLLDKYKGIIREVVPAYTTLLVYYEPRAIRLYDLEQCVEQAAAEVAWPIAMSNTGKLVEVPVCYGGDFGPELTRVAAQAKLSEAQVIELHSEVEYQVAALGFAPGFAYLSGLHEKLITPRLETPRKKVPAGSLGIAGAQTAVYPFAGPGGWNLIGRAAMRWFNPRPELDGEAMTPVEVGDRVRFKPVSAETLNALLRSGEENSA